MTSNRDKKAQRWVLEMLEHAETAAALEGYSAEDAFEIGAEAKRLVEILHTALAQPAAGEPVATWVSLTAAGQLRKGDKIRFRFGQETLTETVAIVLDAGTEREEIVYNRKRNFYFITSKALAGTSSAKEVEVLRTVASPPAAAHGDECPSEQVLESAGLGYPLGKEEAVQLWYQGIRSEIITVLEAWQAIGNDIHTNPGKDELLEALQHMRQLVEQAEAGEYQQYISAAEFVQKKAGAYPEHAQVFSALADELREVIPEPAAHGDEAVRIDARLLELYQAPFRFDERGGYIWDAQNNMVADNHVEGDQAMRVRGWGRLSYRQDGEEVQDLMGQAMADALTARWEAAMRDQAGEGESS